MIIFLKAKKPAGFLVPGKPVTEVSSLAGLSRTIGC
jgi:hypothetical protein